MTDKMYSGGYRSDTQNGDFEVRIRNGKYGVTRIDGSKRVPGQLGWLKYIIPMPPQLESKMQYFNFPLWIGKEWKGIERLRTWQDSHSIVTGIETVVTPAGTLEAYRLERRMVMFVDIRNLYDTEVYFYSPQARTVVKYDYKREMKDLVGEPQYGLQETVAIELLSFKAEPESSDVRKAIGGDL